VTGERRARRVAEKAIACLGLDLGGLHVLTEAASGPYLWTPLLAALAGAGRVEAVAADTPYHRAEDVRTDTLAAAERWGVADRLRVVSRATAAPEEADVVTNTGAVRPIDAALVARLRGTAVVALMWETWEHLPEQVDLDACRARGVLVLGTDERRGPCAIAPYVGLLGVRALLDLGLEVVRTRVVVLGGQDLVAGGIERGLRAAGADVVRVAALDDLRVGDAEALVVAEHAARAPLALPVDELAGAGTAVAVVAGTVDAGALRAAGVPVTPERIAPPGAMSLHAGMLGVRPVLELYAAGLRVGEVAARARLEGLGVREAARRALCDAPAMDFPGEAAWA
jgi:hypothetical protein